MHDAGEAGRRARRFSQWGVDAVVLVHEIMATSARLIAAGEACGRSGSRGTPRWSLLNAVERTWGCPSISDLARALRISRQAAQRLVVKAARMGDVQLRPAPDDRRDVTGMAGRPTRVYYP